MTHNTKQKTKQLYTEEDLYKPHTNPTVVVVGLGYVGLPLALHLSHHFRTIGLDMHKEKIEELQRGHDRMHEASTDELRAAKLEYTNDKSRIKEGDVVIAAVPTPVDEHNIPDLSPLDYVSHDIGKNLKRGSIVVYESTVYPGVTEDFCTPILEGESGFVANKDFFIGYSPERINPGDKEHTIDKIMKIVSGSTPSVAAELKRVYGSVVKAGIHVAPSIKVAEAAKVIENIQRDINIALTNELAMLFDRLDINVHDVLEAAGTKWNFHRYTPGLVGGHCIGVDPYYLTYKAVEVNYHPNIILAGRRVNDRMHSFYAKKLVAELNRKGIPTSKATVAVLGLTFKENCPDYRNSRSVYLVQELISYGCRVVGFDPWLNEKIVQEEFGCEYAPISSFAEQHFDGAVIVVPHDEFRALDLAHIPAVVDIKAKWRKNGWPKRV